MLIFDSRSTEYKKPYGAVKSGTEVIFRVRADGAPPELVLTYENEGSRTETVAMKQDEGCFSALVCTEGHTGLIWYYFSHPGDGYYGPGAGRPGGECVKYENSPPPAYRITVYARESVSRYGEGITYHIFADRFCRMSVPDGEAYGGRRRIHGDWYEAPAYGADSEGRVRNDDFYGGSIDGIISKLDYLESLNVSTIYLSPVFEASENHRYNTGDYEKIDPMLGSNEDFSHLCAEAKRRGMTVMLDGVFSHTGADSRYFNLYGSYGNGGAAKDRESPYYRWYSFEHWPDKYSCWWGVPSLPQTNEKDESFREYILSGKDSIIRRWMRAGADSWRLDVADELPDSFISELVSTVREENPAATVIGEVWEDASDKISYGERRRFLTEDGLDGVMNYVFRSSLTAYLLYGNADAFRESIEALRENYPRGCFYNLMNGLGTHDTARILTVLGGGESLGISRDEKANYRLDAESYARARDLLIIAAAIQMFFPGSPCIYYGDEAGLQGFEDPFNRMGYPWGREDMSILSSYRALTKIRTECAEARTGEYEPGSAEGDFFSFRRCGSGHTLHIYANRGTKRIKLADSMQPWQHLFGAYDLRGDGVYLPPFSVLVCRT